MIYSLLGVYLNGCAYNVFAEGHPRRWEVTLIFPNSGLDTKELNATLGLVPLINRRNLHNYCLVS